MTASSKAVPKSSPHSRFIPREEIDAVSAWHFSAIDGSDIGSPPSPQPPLADEPVPEPVPQPSLEQVLAETRQRAFSEGFADGHSAGARETREALEATVRRTAEETAVRMGQILHSTTDQLIASEQHIARQVLELACDIARQVVRQELKVNTRHLHAVIGEALEIMVEDGLPATVRMHPDDLALMRGSLLETLGETAPELVGDATLSPGGCMVQSASSVVDATIEKRWTRALGNLGMSLEWHPEDADV